MRDVRRVVLPEELAVEGAADQPARGVGPRHALRLGRDEVAPLVEQRLEGVHIREEGRVGAPAGRCLGRSDELTAHPLPLALAADDQPGPVC